MAVVINTMDCTMVNTQVDFELDIPATNSSTVISSASSEFPNCKLDCP